MGSLNSNDRGTNVSIRKLLDISAFFPLSALTPHHLPFSLSSEEPIYHCWMCRADSQHIKVGATPSRIQGATWTQTSCLLVPQDRTAETPPHPAADIEKEPLGSSILNTVTRGALVELAGKCYTPDDKLADLWRASGKKELHQSCERAP